MAAIALFGNFGPLQAALVVIGFALLEDEEELAAGGRSSSGSSSRGGAAVVTGAALLCAAAASGWTLHELLTGCAASWSVAPLCQACNQAPPHHPNLSPSSRMPPPSRSLLEQALLLLGAASLGATTSEAMLAALLLLGSAPALCDGLGVALPLAPLLNTLNVGASPYGASPDCPRSPPDLLSRSPPDLAGLFAIMTGVGGRPVALLEGAMAPDGPWLPIPLRYQVCTRWAHPPPTPHQHRPTPP